mgnify:CR=1 FL=1
MITKNRQIIKRIIFTNDRKFSKLLVALSAILVALSVAGVLYVIAPQKALAATNIDFTYRYAWNDVIGWIDFYFDDVNVSSQKLSGYASSAVGYIAFDCVTSPSPPANCDVNFPNWKVSNDGSGYLSGWAWNDAIGWISFDSATAGSSYFYQVTIGSDGVFTGWAWNDIVGWISFNCNNSGIGNTCPPFGSSDYKVKTSWGISAITGELTSAIFDTQILKGAAPNAILWQGTLNGGQVKFQIGSSNCTNGATNPPTCTTDAGWLNKFIGPDGTGLTYYEPIGPNEPVSINLAHHNNKRYIRYKAVLVSNSTQTASPKVDDIIINWSP